MSCSALRNFIANAVTATQYDEWKRAAAGVDRQVKHGVARNTEPGRPRPGRSLVPRPAGSAGANNAASATLPPVASYSWPLEEL
jgi:hypothetical protein